MNSQEIADAFAGACNETVADIRAMAQQMNEMVITFNECAYAIAACSELSYAESQQRLRSALSDGFTIGKTFVDNWAFGICPGHIRMRPPRRTSRRAHRKVMKRGR